MPKSKHWKYDSHCEYRNQRRVATSHYCRTERISDKTFHERIKKCQDAFAEDDDTYKYDVAESFLKQNSRLNGLSGPQIKMLERWEESVEKLSAWTEVYKKSPKKRELFAFAAKYYSETRYFSSVTRRYREDPEWYVPSHNFYQRMTENTYFQRWLPEAKKAPRFSTGDIVEGRAGSYDHASAIYLITDVHREIDPCKGGRWYTGHVMRDTGRYSWKNISYAKANGGLRRFREKDVKPFKKGKKAKE